MKNTFNFSKFSQNNFDVADAAGLKDGAGQPVPQAPQNAQGQPSVTSTDAKKPEEKIGFEDNFFKKHHQANKLRFQLDAAKEQVESLRSIFTDREKASGRSFEIVPTFDVDSPCKIRAELTQSYVSVEEVKKAFNDYASALRVYAAKMDEYMAELNRIKEETQKMAPSSEKTDQTAQTTSEISKRITEKNKTNNEYNLLIRKNIRFNTFAPDQDKLYKLMAQICTVQTRYEAEIKTYSIGSNITWNRLITLYTQCLRVTMQMRNKVSQAVAFLPPDQREIIQETYNSYIESFTAKINELRAEPAKKAFEK